MRVKASASIFSSSRKTPGGAPQGTRSGNFLFCLSTSDLLGETVTDLRINGKSSWICDTSDEETPGENVEHTPPPRWKPVEVKALKFVDDITAREKSDITAAVSTWSTHKERRDVWAKHAEEFFNTVNTNAEEINMKVNPQKWPYCA